MTGAAMAVFCSTSGRTATAKRPIRIADEDHSQFFERPFESALGLPSSDRNYRQQNMGRMLRIVENRVRGYGPAAIVIQRLSRIGIYVKMRKIAAGNIQPDAMAFLKDQRGWIHLNRERIDFAGLH